MTQQVLHVALVVRDYYEALDFFINKVYFTLLEDPYQHEKYKGLVTVLNNVSQRLPCRKDYFQGVSHLYL